MSCTRYLRREGGLCIASTLTPFKSFRICSNQREHKGHTYATATDA
jgi:hypothetical protein